MTRKNMKKLLLLLTISTFALSAESYPEWGGSIRDDGISPLPTPPAIVVSDNNQKPEVNSAGPCDSYACEPQIFENIPQALVEGITIGAATGTLYALVDAFVSKQLQTPIRPYLYGLTIPLASMTLEPLARLYFVSKRIDNADSKTHKATLFGAAWIASWISYVATITKTA